jgi:apolipoprotein D and lipocalin family protein
MKVLFVVLSCVMLSSVARGQDPAKSPLKAVADLDISRYVGTWHEIARLPFRFQDQCVGDVTATYSLRPDGNLTVVNRCRTKDGGISEASGIAKRASANGPNSKLKVRFAPGWLSFLPFVWGDYWVIDLAPDYSYAAIGEPGRTYLWVLSRTPSIDETVLQRVLEGVRQNGYDLSRLIRTPTSGR